jgi:hypothetical protein
MGPGQKADFAGFGTVERAVAQMEIRPSEAEADLDVVVGEALVAATLAHRADDVRAKAGRLAEKSPA